MSRAGPPGRPAPLPEPRDPDIARRGAALCRQLLAEAGKSFGHPYGRGDAGPAGEDAPTSGGGPAADVPAPPAAGPEISPPDEEDIPF